MICRRTLHRLVDKTSIGRAMLLLVLAVVALAPSLSISAPMQMLSASSFATQALKGVTISSRTHLTQRDFQELATSGAKLVRMSIALERCSGCSSYQTRVRDFMYAKEVVAIGKALGFYVVIALEPLPAGHGAEYWHNARLRESIADEWQNIATAFKDEPSVAGYDLINEPLPPELTATAQNAAWFDFASQLISAIRQRDANHVVIVEVAPWGLPKGFASLPNALPHPNLVYSFHFYEPHQLTHQGLNNYRSTVPYPSDASSEVGAWNKDRLSALLAPVRRFARDNHVPVYVGEFSCIRWAPAGSAYRYVRDVIELFDAEKWSWTYHQYRGWNGWDPEVVSESRADVPRNAASPIFQLLGREFLGRK